jgi:hypothetical protein
MKDAAPVLANLIDELDAGELEFAVGGDGRKEVLPPDQSDLRIQRNTVGYFAFSVPCPRRYAVLPSSF